MFKFKEAVQRYRVAKRFGLPFNFYIKAFLLGEGTLSGNFEKMINDKGVEKNKGELIHESYRKKQ